ncbi:MAG: lytic transglycosylase domain-containing protein [Acidimicrobiales bacterium]
MGGVTENLGRNVAAGVAGLVVVVLLLASAAVGGLGSSSGATASTGVAAIPTEVLTIYIEASATCPGLSWTVLAAIGTVESDNGTSTAPGVDSGANFAGAEGPMQFEPSTFAEYAEPVPPDGADPPSPYDEVDAVYAAARLLCANGAANGVDVSDAIYSYNHSSSYVAEVLTLAGSYAAEPVPTGATGMVGGPPS